MTSGSIAGKLAMVNKDARPGMWKFNESTVLHVA